MHQLLVGIRVLLLRLGIVRQVLTGHLALHVGVPLEIFLREVVELLSVTKLSYD